MFKQLYRKLTLLYTITTGTILTLVVIALSIITQLYTTNKNDELFQNYIMNISMKLQIDSNFNISWLASMEADNNLLIHIEDNKIPLQYRSSWKPPTDREVLIQRAKKYAASIHYDTSRMPASSISISPVFTINGDNKDRYQGMALIYPKEKGFKSVIVLYYITPALNALRNQRLIFLLIDLLGIFAVFIVARKFVRNSLEPIEVNNKKQQQFIAAASHELRSPMMVIQSSACAIETDPDQAGQFTKAIQRECKRMSRLVEDMLTLASSDGGTWSMRFEPVDTNTLILNVFESFEPVCQANKVSLLLDLSDDALPYVYADSERLSQLLSILINNALSYNQNKNSISLHAYQKKSHAFIQIVDHGRGIPDDQKELIFDRFYRTDKARKDKSHFGLGLSIAKELVLSHKGTLTVTDTIGGGATFTIKLPVAKFKKN